MTSSVQFDVLKEMSILLSVLYLTLLIAAFTMGIARGTDVGGPALQVSHTNNHFRYETKCTLQYMVYDYSVMPTSYPVARCLENFDL